MVSRRALTGPGLSAMHRLSDNAVTSAELKAWAKCRAQCRGVGLVQRRGRHRLVGDGAAGGVPGTGDHDELTIFLGAKAVLRG